MQSAMRFVTPSFARHHTECHFRVATVKLASL
jgi:hypothetical protein